MAKVRYEVRYTSSSHRSAGDATFPTIRAATLGFLDLVKPVYRDSETEVFLTRYIATKRQIRSDLIAFFGGGEVHFEPAYFLEPAA